MPEDDSWDWPLMLYIATVILKRSESSFWRMTPRKLNALVKAHIAMNKNSEEGDAEGARKGFVDQLY